MIVYLVQKAGQCLMVGLSSDTKPAALLNYMFIELDTAKTFRGTGTVWEETLNASYQPSGGGGGAAWGGITGTLSDQTDLQTALDAKADGASLAVVALSGDYGDLLNPPSLFNGVYSSLSGIPATFAPIIGAGGTQACAGNDSRLSDARTPTQHSITGAEHSFPGGTTTFLRADGTFAAPGGGSDPWTYLRLTSDFTTTSNTAQNVTGLSFTPAANTRYEWEAILMLRTATATVNPRVGWGWPTGMTDGVAYINSAQSATAQQMAFGNINAALLTAVGGLPNTTQSWPSIVGGTALAGATPSGTLRVQLASETNGTTVRIVAESFLKYRVVP